MMHWVHLLKIGGAYRSWAVLRRGCLALSALCLLATLPVRAQLFDEPGGGLMDGLTLEDPANAKVTTDFDKLTASHLSEIDGWQGAIRPANKRQIEKGKAYDWAMTSESGYNYLKSFAQRERLTVQPLTTAPLETRIDVPAAGTYRVWLCYLAGTQKAQPLSLALGETTLTYYEAPISDTATGAEQEAKRPIHFETEGERLTIPSRDTFIWEYRDVALPAGRLTVTLRAKKAGTVRVDALFLTASQSFRPSKALALPDNSLGRSFLRFRVTEADAVEDGGVTFMNNLTYHWRHRVEGMTEPLWYSHLEGDIGGTDSGQGPKGARIGKGEWSRWFEGSSATLSPGQYCTVYLSVAGATGNVRVEMQYAWYPDEGAVLRTLPIPFAATAQRGTLLLPHYATRVPLPVWQPDGAAAAADGDAGTDAAAATEAAEAAAVTEPGDTANTASAILEGDATSTATASAAATATPVPIWGMRRASWLAGLRNAFDVAAEHQAIVDSLQLGDGALPYELHATTTNRADPAVNRETLGMLRSMGFSNVTGPSRQALVDAGLRPETWIAAATALYASNSDCPLDPTSDATLEAHFEGIARDLEAKGWRREDIVRCKLGDEIGAIRPAAHINGCTDCRAHWHAALQAQYGDDPRLFGATRWEDVPYATELRGPGVADRRLHYAASQYTFDYTADFYKRCTAAVEKAFPNCRTYCNFSPHPVVLTGTSMNHSDWFRLTRRGGATLAWGEDWASMSSWGFWMGWQMVSYYAAWVECAAVGSDGHGGFYAVGGGAHQQFACVAHGLDTLLLYTYGPLYSLAEFSNAWSDRPATYASIARGLHALGAADTIIAHGQREAASVGLLYNRDHEIWHPESSRLVQVDRVGAFVAFEHQGLPARIVLEEDLLGDSAALVQAIPALYVNGFNLSAELTEALIRYAEAGGTVILSAGAGSRDRYDGRNPAADRLLGVRPRQLARSAGLDNPSGVEKMNPLDTLTLSASEVFGARSWGVVGLQYALEPLPAEAAAVAAAATKVTAPDETLGTYADGTPGLIRRRLGQGTVYVYGVQPGLIYRARAPRQPTPDAALYNAYDPADAAVLGGPIRAAVGPRSIRYSEPLVELRRFDHAEGTAITLNNFTYRPLAAGVLEVRWPADREVHSVSAGLGGTLEWTRDGEWLRIQAPLLHEADVVVVR